MKQLKFNFTKKAIEKLVLPEKGRTTYHDRSKKGLKLLVRPTGTKTFFLYRKIQGKPERLIIGRFPEITIEQVRKEVDKLNAKIANGIKKFKEKSRDRFIQADELPRFFKAVSEEQNETARDYILISLLTGTRQGNVLAMRWKQINFDRATWTIPETKTGDSHTVPLVTEAIKILQERRVDLNPWVFPSNSKSGHLEDPKKSWNRILERADIKDLRIHDLRRSLGSWQAATGANLSIIGKALAHKNISTTAIYARLNIDPVRDAMDKATQAMFEASRKGDGEFST